MNLYLTKKNCRIDKNFLSSSKIFLSKNTFKEAITYLFNVVILFNTVFYLKLNFKHKIYPKMCYFKTWKKFQKKKTFGNPVYSFCVRKFYSLLCNRYLIALLFLKDLS